MSQPLHGIPNRTDCGRWVDRDHWTAFERTVWLNENLNGSCNMTLRASDVVPISEARARLTELAEDVVGSGAEKVLTKNGASYVAIVDARRLDYYHALEAEHANLVLADDAITGLKQALSGQFVSDEELNEALGVTPLR
jgi:PHD/YefM family antitoxin component YafN of YafNO toxin-antitoxin module